MLMVKSMDHLLGTAGDEGDPDGGNQGPPKKSAWSFQIIRRMPLGVGR